MPGEKNGPGAPSRSQTRSFQAVSPPGALRSPSFPAAGILEMLERVAKSKGIDYAEWFEGLKHKNQVGTAGRQVGVGRRRVPLPLLHPAQRPPPALFPHFQQVRVEVY